MWVVVCKTLLLSLVTVTYSLASLCIFLLQLQPVSNNFDLCGKITSLSLLRAPQVASLLRRGVESLKDLSGSSLNKKNLLLRHCYNLLHLLLNIHLKSNLTDVFPVASELMVTVLFSVFHSAGLPFKNSSVCSFYKSFFLPCDCWRVFWSVSHACLSAVCNNLKTLLWVSAHWVTCEAGPEKIQWAQ